MSLITAANAVRRLVEQRYEDEAVSVIRAISATVERGEVQRRLADLDEALAENDVRSFQPKTDALFSAFDSSMRETGRLLEGAGPGLQAAAAGQADAVIRMGQRNADPRLYARFNEEWTTPDPEALRAGLDFTDRWDSEIAYLVGRNTEIVRNIAIRGQAEGLHPVVVARQLREMIQGLPVASANNIMRTLFLESSRKAQALSYERNADVIERVIRIEALDDRTCMACIALHGSVHWERGENAIAYLPIPPIDEHHQGRGTTVAELRNYPMEIETGEEWFRRQPPDKQQRIIEVNYSRKQATEPDGLLARIQSGEVVFSQFVGEYRSPVYGRMVRQATLSEIGVGRLITPELNSLSTDDYEDRIAELALEHLRAVDDGHDPDANLEGTAGNLGVTRAQLEGEIYRVTGYKVGSKPFEASLPTQEGKDEIAALRARQLAATGKYRFPKRDSTERGKTAYPDRDAKAFKRQVGRTRERTIYDYSFQGDTPLNHHLLGYDASEITLRRKWNTRRIREQFSNDLSELIAEYDGKTPPVVWRGMYGETVSKSLARLLPGEVYENLAFTSTSTDAGLAWNFSTPSMEIITKAKIAGKRDLVESKEFSVILEIKPNPKRGAAIRAMSRFDDEDEWLVDKGGNFKLLGVKEVDFGFRGKQFVYQLEEE